MSVLTVVINKSDTPLKLKEGNGGVYVYLTTLKERIGKHTIRCNTTATYREYWVGTGLDNEDGTVLTITSDDCLDYQTVYIINDPDNSKKLKLDNVKRGVKETAVVNQTGGDVKVLKSGSAETHVLKTGEKFVIKRDPEKTKDCNYSVEAGGETIKISTHKVARAQRINISGANSSTPGQANTSTGQANSTSTPGQTKVDMVSRRLYLTEVTNKTSVAIMVKHHKVAGGLGFWRGGNTSVEATTLQTDEIFTIEYDPKKGRNCSVEYAASTAPSAAAGAAPSTPAGAAPSTSAGAAPSTSAGAAPSTSAGAAPSTPAGAVWIASTDFAEFERIDIVTKAGPGTELDLEKLEPRPSLGPSKDGFVSRVFRFAGF